MMDGAHEAGNEAALLQRRQRIAGNAVMGMEDIESAMVCRFEVRDVIGNDKHVDFYLEDLKAADFFAADSIATATFNITGVTATGVTGDLTVLGVTKSIEVPATVTYAGDVMTVTGTLLVNFLDFGVQYLVAGDALPEAEKATSATPEASIEINLTLNRPAAAAATAATTEAPAAH